MKFWIPGVRLPLNAADCSLVNWAYRLVGLIGSLVLAVRFYLGVRLEVGLIANPTNLTIWEFCWEYEFFGSSSRRFFSFREKGTRSCV